MQYIGKSRELNHLPLPEAALKLSGGEGQVFTRRLNDELAEVVAQASRSLWRVRRRALDEPRASLAETEYALDTPHFHGVSAPAQFKGSFLGRTDVGRTFYFDLTASTNEGSLDLLRKLVSAEQLFMGFDFPLMSQQTIAPAIAAFEAYQGFDSVAKKDILINNAKNLLSEKNL